MNLLPIWAKALIVAALLAACAWGVHRYNQSIRDDQRALDVAEYNVRLLAAQEDARAQESAWQAKQKHEQEVTNEQLNRRDAQYAAAAGTIAGLRNTLSNLGNGLPTITATACGARISALSTVFAECTNQLAEMGRAAQGQLIDAVSCRSSWPSTP